MVWGVVMNKKELLEWAVENIRKGKWPTLQSGVRKQAPEGAFWKFMPNAEIWVLYCHGGGIVRADMWEAEKRKKKTKGQTYRENQNALGMSKVCVEVDPEGAEFIKKYAAERRAKIRGENNGN